MTTALITFACSALALSIIAGVFRVEDAREGKRVVFGRIRAYFDRFLRWVLGVFTRVKIYLSKSIFRLMFHYSAHTILTRIHAFTRSIHDRVEYIMRQNKQTARTIHSEKQRTHLDAIAEHKEETALSQEERERRRSHE